MNILWGLLGFAITIGILVTIHEWGHFAVARFFGVKILRFSLGFGKPFLSWTGKKDGTQYTLAPIPLGGFVQMLGENSDDGDIAPEDKNRTFAGKPAWQRFLIAFAGPFVNLAFAVFAFAAVYWHGIEGVYPEIIYVQPHSIAAEAGLRAGDRFLEIDGYAVRLSTDANIALVGAGHKTTPIRYQRTDGSVAETSLDLRQLKAGDELHIGEVMGLRMADEWFPARVGKVIADSPAAKAGLQVDDRIAAIDGKAIETTAGVYQATDVIKTLGNKEAVLSIERQGQLLTLPVHFEEKTNANGKKAGYLGIYWGWQKPDAAFFDHYGTVERYGIFTALQKGAQKVVYYVDLTFTMFGRMLSHKVSLDNMGGPLTIGDAAGQTLQLGATVFLNFLGLVSLSLAAINLLPIPMLDGGHMLFCVVEMVRGKALSEKTMQWCYRVGATLVFTFMGLLILKDFWKYLG